jgi:cyclopropane-fatty-acyl-phospholipid synthase
MLGTLLRSVIQEGTLNVIGPGGKRHSFGAGEPVITVTLHDRRAVRQLVRNPDLAFGELYMDGRLTVDDGDIRGLLELLTRNVAGSGRRGLHRFVRFLRNFTKLFAQFNPARRARKNVAHHYDLSRHLYDAFLDRDRQYSCAYFADPSASLEEAQAAKKRHIAAKLNLDRAGLRILDIGSGWGGLALDLARHDAANVLGITLSEEQLALSRDRASRSGLSKSVTFSLTDYRDVEGQFDRIVSVGMFEHVGAPHYGAFFRKLSDLLTDDGVALLHTIGRVDGPGTTNAWIAKYIFPGGYAPALSEIVPAIEKAGLLVTDIEVLRGHYADTLREWQKRFQACRDEMAKLYDERFCRMWEFYLAGSEMAFRYDGEVVYQIQIAKRLDSLPRTRDYMFERERMAQARAETQVAA